jgi:hypothetical protein
MCHGTSTTNYFKSLIASCNFLKDGCFALKYV